MKRKRLPVDHFIWSIFVTACGDRCSVCGEENVPLERGHRISHGSDGSDSWDNLLPVCLPCNKRHLKTETPDNYRPADYLERFSIMLLQTLGPQISVYTENGLSYLIPSSYPVENKQVICWGTAENSVLKEVFTQSSDTMTRAEANDAVERLITLARRRSPQPPFPFAATKTELVQLAMKHGSRFRIAARAFLAEDWSMAGSPDVVQSSCWVQFTANFEQFVAAGLVLEQRARERKRKDADQRAIAAADERKRRWATFLRIAECAGVTDDDHAFVVDHCQETELRDVTDEELRQSQEIWSREFYVRHRVLAAMLRVCDRLVAESEGEHRLSAQKQFSSDLNKANSIEELRLSYKKITILYGRLKKDLGLAATTQRYDRLFAQCDEAWGSLRDVSDPTQEDI
jgi:hypothetical protein